MNKKSLSELKEVMYKVRGILADAIDKIKKIEKTIKYITDN